MARCRQFGATLKGMVAVTGQPSHNKNNYYGGGSGQVDIHQEALSSAETHQSWHMRVP